MKDECNNRGIPFFGYLVLIDADSLTHLDPEASSNYTKKKCRDSRCLRRPCLVPAGRVFHPAAVLFLSKSISFWESGPVFSKPQKNQQWLMHLCRSRHGMYLFSHVPFFACIFFFGGGGAKLVGICLTYSVQLDMNRSVKKGLKLCVRDKN